MTEGDDSANARALLQHLSDDPIICHAPDRDAWTDLGSSRQYRFDFTLVYLGHSGPKRWLVANGLLYSDSDALIVVFDPFNPWALDPLKCCLELSVKGTVNSQPRDSYPTVRKGIPWLILANFKGEPLVSSPVPAYS